MRKIFLMLSVLISGFLATSAHATLINGGFETGDLTGWMPGPTFDGAVTNLVANSGTYSLGMEGIDGITQTFSSETILGDLTLWVRAESLIFTGPTTVTVDYSDSTNTSLSIGGASLSDTSWTMFTLSLDTNKLLNSITIFTGETGTLYFDDISLLTSDSTGGGTEPGEPVPEPPTMLLLGAGLAGLIGSRIRRKKKA